MCRSDSQKTGGGETPAAAVQDLIPTDRNDVAWVEGLQSFPNRNPQSDEQDRFRRDLTVIYESEPAEQWRVEAVLEDTKWCAYLTGTKPIY